MTASPRVSIVMPLFDDEGYVAAALDSCLAQTLTDLEVLCVDDASTDRTVAIVEQYAQRDDRVRLIRQPANLSAYQARRAGISAATAPYVLFLDGDDELDPNAARAALTKAISARADVVGFGVEIVVSDTGAPKRFEDALQPRHRELHAPNIVPRQFPVSEEANGHLWRYLWATPLLRAAYEDVPDDQKFYRANDLPITLLALAQATKYVSIPQRLYRYYFRRGTSGHAISGIEHFQFLASGIEPITSIGGRIRDVARATGGDALVASYESARLHIIGNVLRYCIRDTSGALQDRCLALLKDTVGDLDVIRAAANFCSAALPALSLHADEPSQPRAPVQSVLLTTRHLKTGGLQAVLLEQAAQLVADGHRVTIAVLRDAGRDVELPPGVDLVEVTGADKVARIDHWLAICRDYEIDVIIDHHILYNENWPWFALSALAEGVPTIGWVHNFALRPLFDRSRRTSFLTTHMRVLLNVVTLSPADVTFWKLQGLERVVYLPDPPSPLTYKALVAGAPRTAPEGRIELAWWGRLDRYTKQVYHLIEVAQELRARGVNFRLTIIGPDSRNLTAAQVRNNAVGRGVGDAVDLIGEQSADELVATLTGADLLISTSAIEGFQLTIIEAQALGMPVVMYDLPWLTTVRGNDGLVTTQPEDAGAMADAIARIANDPARYEELSRAARAFAQSAATVDTAGLLKALLRDELPSEYAPDPTIDDARLLLQWMANIAERNLSAPRDGKESSADVASMRRERDRARRELAQITEGPSFRVGRAITFLPRKLRTWARSGLRRSGPVRATSRMEQAAPPPPPPLKAASTAAPARSTTPDVTFVIPVYNSAPWLDDCLGSVLAQTGVDVEVICINDGSTDDSRAILQRYADADARVTIIDQPNSGQSVGRNKGLDAATGRYVIYLDSDDYWPEDAVSKLVQRADEELLDVLLFDCVTFRDGDIDEKTWRWYSTYYQRAHTYRQVSPGVDLMVSMRRGRDYRPHVGLYLARTEFVRQLGLRFIPGIVHQDNPYTFRLLLNAQRAAHVSRNAYARRIRPGSTITMLNADRSARGYFLSYLEMMRELDGRELPAGADDVVNNIVDYVYDGARKQFALISPSTAEEIRTLDERADAQAVFASLVDAAAIERQKTA